LLFLVEPYLRWQTNPKPAGAVIDENKVHFTGYSELGIVTTTEPITTGRRYWQVKTSYGSGSRYNIFSIGFVDAPLTTQQLKAKLSETDGFCTRGSFYQDSGSTVQHYFRKVQQRAARVYLHSGDTIAFFVDMTARTCEVFVNNESLGILCRGFSGTVFPAVSGEGNTSPLFEADFTGVPLALVNSPLAKKP